MKVLQSSEDLVRLRQVHAVQRRGELFHVVVDFLPHFDGQFDGKCSVLVLLFVQAFVDVHDAREEVRLELNLRLFQGDVL